MQSDAAVRPGSPGECFEATRCATPRFTTNFTYRLLSHIIVSDTVSYLVRFLNHVAGIPVSACYLMLTFPILPPALTRSEKLGCRTAANRYRSGLNITRHTC